MRVPKIISITDLRQGAAEIVEEVRESYEPVVITQRSHAVAVLLGATAYEKMTYEREVLGILAKGEAEIRKANGLSLDQVLAEATRLLEMP